MKDDLQKTKQGQQALALIAQLYGADKVDAALEVLNNYVGTAEAWDGDFNAAKDKVPFNRSNLAQRILTVLESPNYVRQINGELPK